VKIKTNMGIQLHKLVTRVRDMFADTLAGVNEETGELDPELVALLEQAELKDEAEALDAACAVKELDAIDAAFEAEANRVRARRATIARQRAMFTALIEKAIPAGQKVSDERVSISWRKSTGTLVGVEPEDLPKRFTRVKIEADKTLIAAALKAGKTVEGCSLEERQNLQIK